MSEIAIGSATIVVLVVFLATGLVYLRRRLVPDAGLDVTVNGARHLVAHRGDALLGVLHDAGVLIPAACGGSGTCGLCRVTVTGDGAGQPQATERGVLSPRERRAHVRLACQTRLRGDCAVAVPDDILSAGGGFACKVASVRMLAPLIREIVVDLPPDRSSDFKAGDFMQITAPPYALDFSDVDVPPEFSDAWELAGWRDLMLERIDTDNPGLVGLDWDYKESALPCRRRDARGTSRPGSSRPGFSPSRRGTRSRFRVRSETSTSSRPGAR